jgi:hypothetical protein
MGQEEGEKVKTFEWSCVFSYRRWTIFWRATLLNLLAMHFYSTRLVYANDGFWTALLILALPVVGDAGVTRDSELPLLRWSFQAGITMLLVAWFWRVCLRAHRLIPAVYGFPDGSKWQRNRDGSEVCVQWSRSFVNGIEYEFDPDTGIGRGLPKPPAPRKP